MTTPCNSTTITEELWHNAQLSGVSSPNKHSKVTNNGHGLYVLAEDGSSYADLRMSTERPFWGHSHPLVTQNNSGQLIPKESDYHFITSTELSNYLKHHKKINFSEIGSLPQNSECSYLLELTDKDFLKNDRTLIFEALQNSSLRKKIWVHHNNTLLSTQDDFFFEDINFKLQGESYGLIFSQGIVFTNKDIAPCIESALLSSFENYVRRILINKTHGKFVLNQNILDRFISTNDLELERKFNFLIYRNIPEVDHGPFKEAGIIISDSNKIKNDLYFSIPVACTTSELLDTLNRIVLVLKGQSCLF